MLFAGLRNWIPIALCCIPAVVIAVVGLGIAISGAGFGASLGGPLGLGLIVPALLLCPLFMGWMMWRMRKQHGTSGNSARMAEVTKLAELEAQREALLREKEQSSDKKAVMEI